MAVPSEKPQMTSFDVACFRQKWSVAAARKALLGLRQRRHLPGIRTSLPTNVTGIACRKAVDEDSNLYIATREGRVQELQTAARSGNYLSRLPVNNIASIMFRRRRRIASSPPAPNFEPKMF